MKCMKHYALSMETEKLDPALLFSFLFLKYYSLTNTIHFTEGIVPAGNNVNTDRAQVARELSYFGLEAPEVAIISALKRKYDHYGNMVALDNLLQYFDALEKDVAKKIELIFDVAAGETEYQADRIKFDGHNMYKLDTFFAELLYGSVSYLPKHKIRSTYNALLEYASDFLNFNNVVKDSKINFILSEMEWKLVELLMDLNANPKRYEINELRRGFRKAKLTVAVSVLEGNRPPSFHFEVMYPRGSEYGDKHVPRYRHASSESSESEDHNSHETILEKISNVITGTTSSEQFEGERFESKESA